MTELQFLIDLLLNHRLTKQTKDLIAKRIGDVEASYAKIQKPIAAAQSGARMVNGVMQAASTAAALERDPAIAQAQPIISGPIEPIPASALAINRIKGGEVNTGNGTKGPRKF